MSEAKIKKISSEDLKQFDGLNGHPLYIVFKGKIYDLTSSKLWPQGKHMGMHNQSQDLTEAIKKAPHGEDNVYRYPLIGELAEATLQASAPPTPEKKPTAPQAQLPIQPKPADMETRELLKLAAAVGAGAIILVAVLAILKALTFVPAGRAITLAAVLASFKAATVVPKSTVELAWLTVT